MNRFRCVSRKGDTSYKRLYHTNGITREQLLDLNGSIRHPVPRSKYQLTWSHYSYTWYTHFTDPAYYIAFSCVCGLVYIYRTNQREVPFLKRKRFLIESHALESFIGNLGMSDAKRRYTVLADDSTESVRVNAVVKRILEAMKHESLEVDVHAPATQFEWEVVVVESDSYNAQCYPGGKIVVFSGLLTLYDNDDELAAVLALTQNTFLRVSKISRESFSSDGYFLWGVNLVPKMKTKNETRIFKQEIGCSGSTLPAPY
eukprot:PhF_6_TR5122/c1_g1_i2/m.7260